MIRERDDIARAVELVSSGADGTIAVDEHTRRLTVPSNGGAQRLVRLLRDLDEAGIAIDDIALRRPTLDDVFLSLTGHAAEPGAEPSEENGRDELDTRRVA